MAFCWYCSSSICRRESRGRSSRASPAGGPRRQRQRNERVAIWCALPQSRLISCRLFRSDAFCVASLPLTAKNLLLRKPKCADELYIVLPTFHPTSARSARSSPAACCGCAAAMRRQKRRPRLIAKTFAYTSRPPSAVMRTPRERERMKRSAPGEPNSPPLIVPAIPKQEVPARLPVTESAG
jgi:hypothetical protein